MVTLVSNLIYVATRPLCSYKNLPRKHKTQPMSTFSISNHPSMAKFLDSSYNFLRRSYTAAAETVRMQPAAMRKAGDLSAGFTAKQEKYWMKDPKTGNWVPETHFVQVDAAELRDKLLPKKEKL